MNKDQRFTPKYWVVHDKTTDDVFISTARKNYSDSVDAFLAVEAYNRWGIADDERLHSLFHEDDNLELILVEVKIYLFDIKGVSHV